MQHCIIQQLTASPDNLTEITQIIRREVIPHITKQPGLKVAYYVTNEAGAMWMFQVWDDRELFTQWQSNPRHDQAASKIRKLRNGDLHVDKGYVLQAAYVKSESD